MTRTNRLLPLCLLGSAALLPAQIWTETGDANDLCSTAQIVAGQGQLAAIAGSLSSNADADVYAIEVDDPVNFVATTIGGATFDTMLMLFDADGLGIVGNDDFGTSLQSRVDGTHLLRPGRYFLAVSAFGTFANTPAGPLFGWAGSVLLPLGPGGREALSAWVSGGNGSGSYTVALTGAKYCSKQIVLPDNHHFSESAQQLGVTGSTAWWRQTGGRFQLLYEASHFLNGGVNGTVTINRLRFRAEDGEPNLGGASWSGATVRLGATSLNAATLTTNFATNLLGATTTVGTLGTTTVALGRSLGTTPNNDCIVIDLAAIGAQLAFDPTGVRPNLLIDITLPNAAVLAPTTGSVPPFADTSGGTSFVRGIGLNTATPGGATGTLSLGPVVVGLDFVGNGGDRIVVPARTETFGAACGGSPSSFYQAFVTGQVMDLQALSLTPDNPATPTTYTVTGASDLIDFGQLNPTPNSIADDAVVSHNLGFTFRFPGGSTTSIAASTNGFVWLDGSATTTDVTPTVEELLGITTASAPRLAPCWYDFHCGRNTTSNALAGLHVRTDTNSGPGHAVCYVTWYLTGVFNSANTPDQAQHTMQCVLHEDSGLVEFRYSSLPDRCSNYNSGTHHAAIVGWSRGRIGNTPSADPRSRDLSVELPFTTGIEGGANHIGLSAVSTPVAASSIYGARAFAGQTLTWNISDLPAGTVLGVLLLDFATTRPGFALPTITAPGCMLSMSANTLLWEVNVLPPSAVTGSVPFYVPAGFDGVDLHAQYVVLNGLFGGPDLISAASNAIRYTVGKR
ncbi:MAG: DVUA0089 family protein [Planctomycetes bacterium]|nr:DVUA0089 family protein [Planctomycetota bacterium]